MVQGLVSPVEWPVLICSGLSKLQCLLGYPLFRGPYYGGDLKRDANSSNLAYVHLCQSSFLCSSTGAVVNSHGGVALLARKEPTAFVFCLGFPKP